MKPSALDMTGDPAAVRARKRPLDRRVDFAVEPGRCATPEGSVSYAQGDAIVTGERGERWPIELAVFLASYEPVPPLKFGEDGSYRRRALPVLARRLERDVAVAAGHGRDLLSGRAGDWLVQHADGTFSVVAPAVFAETYEVG